MINYTVKELVSGGKQVQFLHYRHGELWYEVEGTNFTFPVPIDDVGNATMFAKDKSLLFMRYIRKHMKFIEMISGETNPT